MSDYLLCGVPEEKLGAGSGNSATVPCRLTERERFFAEFLTPGQSRQRLRPIRVQVDGLLPMTSTVVTAEATKTDVDAAPVSKVRRLNTYRPSLMPSSRRR